MKKITLFLIFMPLFWQLSAQSELPYKPFETFNNDTLAFMDYNFRQRAEYYKGKTVGEVLEDISLPIISFTRYMRGRTTICIIVNTEPVHREFKSNYIRIYLQTPVDSKELNLLRVKNGNEYSNAWNPKLYEFLKNEKVESVAPNHYRLWKEKGIRMY